MHSSDIPTASWAAMPALRDMRIPVWTLVQLKKLGRTEAELRADFPGLTQDDLDAVWAYYRDHTDEIENVIAAEARED